MIVAVMVRAVQNFIAAVYQANGYTKQIASTTIIGALINLAINLVLVFFIGAWSVAIALLISYVVLATYRYFDIRKYNIVLTLESKTLTIFLSLLTVVLVLYYVNNMWLNIINIVLAAVAILVFNRKIILDIIEYGRKKLLP